MDAADSVGILKKTWSKIFGWWMAFARFLGTVNTILLLSLMYILIIGPAWFVMRFLRKDPLRRRIPEHGSFWLEKPPLGHTLEETRHQF